MSSINISLIIRSALRQKMYTSINIIGLACGMACCLLIASFIYIELSFDKYHLNNRNIYRVISELTLGKSPNMIASTNSLAAITMMEDYPGVVDAVRLRPMPRIPVRYVNGEKEFYEDNIFYTEPSFFRIFSYPMLRGNPETALNRPQTVVITSKVAMKYFGENNPIGETLRLNDQTDYTITGVLDKVPENSHFNFDFLLSFESLYGPAGGREKIESWSTPFIYYSYVLLESDQDASQLEKEFPGMIDKNINQSWKNAGVSLRLFLQPLLDIHLYSNLRHEIGTHGDIRNVYIFGSVAIIVLIIACLNFVNLATARSSLKAGEVGIRKILGSSKRDLIVRFMSESLLFSFISLLIALFLVMLLLPVFSTIAERDLSLSIFEIPLLMPLIVLFTFVIGLICGIYPALFLSSFRPQKILRPDHESVGQGKRFRKTLVIIQFTISIFLIISTQVVFDQLLFLKDKNLGFDKDQTIVIPILNEEIRRSVGSIKHQLTTLPGVVRVSASSHVPGQRASGGSYQPEGYEAGHTIMMDGMSIDEDYLDNMGIEVLAGRNFSREFPADFEKSILINETAVKEIGWEQPLGKKIEIPGQEEGKTVIGVVNDFFFKSPHQKIRSMHISMGPRPYRALLVKISPLKVSQTIDAIIGKWRSIDPNRSLDYYFLDASYDKQFQAEEKLSNLLTFFTLLAILIACLGLYGMSSFMAEQRIMEISIRKVLGASTNDILLLLSRSTLFLILTAFVVAIPVGYFTMTRWLDSFEYRVNIGFEVFVIAGGLAILVAALTIIFQSMKVALSNPVHSLKNE